MPNVAVYPSRLAFDDHRHDLVCADDERRDTHNVELGPGDGTTCS